MEEIRVSEEEQRADNGNRKDKNKGKEGNIKIRGYKKMKGNERQLRGGKLKGKRK